MTDETADDHTTTEENFLCIKRGVRFWSDEVLGPNLSESSEAFTQPYWNEQWRAQATEARR